MNEFYCIAYSKSYPWCGLMVREFPSDGTLPSTFQLEDELGFTFDAYCPATKTQEFIAAANHAGFSQKEINNILKEKK